MSATDGSGMTRLTTNDTSDYDADWSNPGPPSCPPSTSEGLSTARGGL
jgi:hypothetical protein